MRDPGDVAGLGVDNARVELDGPEVPIMDGSSAPFVFLIQSAGIEEQNAPKKFIRVTKPIEVKDGDKWARFEPYEGYKLAFSIVFNHPAIDKSAQKAEIDFAEQSYVREVSRARTFGFMQEVEYLRENSDLLFDPDHPYHGMVMGSHEDIQAARLEDVRDFFRRYYAPDNAMVVVAGDSPMMRSESIARLLAEYRRAPAACSAPSCSTGGP